MMVEEFTNVVAAALRSHPEVHRTTSWPSGEILVRTELGEDFTVSIKPSVIPQSGDVSSDTSPQSPEGS